MQRVFNVFTRFFDFFRIPYFVSRDWIKHLWALWETHFETRDAVDAARENKEASLDAVTGGQLTAAVENIYGALYQLNTDLLNSVYHNMESADTTIKNTRSSVIAALESIENDQNSYKWV